MAKQMFQFDCIPPLTELASGASITGQWIDIGDMESNVSLFLEQSDGSSTSLTVVYEIGYKKTGYEPTPMNANKDDALQNITPSDGGTIADFTTVNLSSAARKHTTDTLPATRWARWKVTNNNNTAKVSLKGIFQK